MFSRHGRVPPWAAGSRFGPFRRPHHEGREESGRAWSGFLPFGRRWGGPGRLFDKGDLKYVILDLLRQRPRHGYDIIRALEERFGGLYSPSPGSVYPTLQLLEDQGYVTSVQQDGKKVYTLTEAGREFLTARADTLDGIRARVATGHGAGGRAELPALMGDLRWLMETIAREARRGAFRDPERARRLRAAVARAREEVEAILAGKPAPSSADV
jgi:DNA-binding PadR family transcriptional regulator